jgi:hypothetical protein
MLRSTCIPTIAFAAVLALVPTSARAATLTVTGTSPTINGQAPRNTVIAVTFDGAVTLAAFNASRFRVFGRGTGTKTGTFPSRTPTRPSPSRRAHRFPPARS